VAVGKVVGGLAQDGAIVGGDGIAVVQVADGDVAALRPARGGGPDEVVVVLTAGASGAVPRDLGLRAQAGAISGANSCGLNPVLVGDAAEAGTGVKRRVGEDAQVAAAPTGRVPVAGDLAVGTAADLVGLVARGALHGSGR